MRLPPQVLRRRSANMRRSFTRHSMQQGTAGSISPGSSSTFVDWRGRHPEVRAQRASKDDLHGVRRPSFETPRRRAAPQDDGGGCGENVHDMLFRQAHDMITFQEARAFLLRHRTDYDKAVAGFRWPDSVPFNWALDWFDAELARDADSKDRTALWIVDAGSDKQTKLSFAALSRRSNQVANFLRAQGLKRGDHLLLLLGNVVPLWETMLAAMKLGVVVIPATTLLTA